MRLLTILAVLIGISSGNSSDKTELKRAYPDAVTRAGGSPLVLPVVRTAAEADALIAPLNGLLMTGGEDIAPWRYRETVLNSTVDINAQRDTSDFLILEAARRKGIPVMGICRGAQEINVFYGGTLYQDLPTQLSSSVAHRQKAPKTTPTHTVKTVPGSRLRFFSKCETLEVNSFHHQAIKDVAPGFFASAYAPDGVIEGIESRNGERQYVLAVQFHPEELIKTADSVKFLPVFKDFVFRCKTASPKNTVNYDPAAIPPYTLEDPLTFADGRKVKNKAQWRERREEILDIFQKEVYGRMPAAPEAVVTEVFDEGVTLNGYGIRKQVRMWFRADRTGPSINWLIVLPRFAKGPVPALLSLNFYGNHTYLHDPEVPVTTGWMREERTPQKKGHRTDGSDRGKFLDQVGATTVPMSTILARGYAFVTACYCDISPDPYRPATGYDLQNQIWHTGIFDLWEPYDPKRTDNTGALMAWGWMLMRGMDMLVKDSAIDDSKVVVTGCSRLGKAALIAGVFDERIAVVVPNQTGCGGCPLNKHWYGENAATMTWEFSHWYCKGFEKYSLNDSAMPFDQHMFLACVAPRALMVQGFDNRWWDTEGEWLALKAASPVWKFLGKKPLPAVEWPEDYSTTGIGEDLAYVRRTEAHGIAAIDWMWMMDFADRKFGK